MAHLTKLHGFICYVMCCLFLKIGVSNENKCAKCIFHFSPTFLLILYILDGIGGTGQIVRYLKDLENRPVPSTSQKADRPKSVTGSASKASSSTPATSKQYKYKRLALPAPSDSTSSFPAVKSSPAAVHGEARAKSPPQAGETNYSIHL